MHMADALISPAVGAVMLTLSAGACAFALRKLKNDADTEKRLPLMAVAGAFVFAAQMINFTIPGTGSSGHISGGIMLAAMLGGPAALVVLSAVLAVQALFFADGGLLALGANIFNMGVIPCLLVYPLVFKPLASRGINRKNIMAASVVASVCALQLGAFSVVLETLASGITALPFTAFLLLMQPIHLAIGIVEGLVTASVLSFVAVTKPEVLDFCSPDSFAGKAFSGKKLLACFAAATLVTAGLFSLYASDKPDGLEWSVEKTAGASELPAEGALYELLGRLQSKTALMPDYSFSGEEKGTSEAGLLGSAVTFAAAALLGLFVSRRRKSRTRS